MSQLILVAARRATVSIPSDGTIAVGALTKLLSIDR